MRFSHLKINGFGKLVQKELDLKPGINVIYGDNEAGKSSLLKFLTSMLYGASKNKNGKNISDFDKYKPWKTEEFSGSLEYILDNGESFEVYREFKKKNASVYNVEKKDISKTFKENKTKGIAFFEEQTGVDEETYVSTAIIEQEEVKLAQGNQNAIIQKISNKVSSGDDNISYKKTLSIITKLQGEKVGTDRTQNRPINIVNVDIKKLEEKRKDLEEIKEIQCSNNKTFEELQKELIIKEKELKLLNELKELHDNYKIKYAEVDFSKNLEDENNKKIEKLREKLQEKQVENNVENKNLKVFYILESVLMVVSILLFILVSNRIFGVVALILSVLNVIYIVIKNKTTKKLVKEQENKTQEDIIKEMNLLKQNNEEKSKEINEKLDKINEEVNVKKEKVYKNYKNILDMTFIEKAFDKTIEELQESTTMQEKNIEKIKHDIHEIEFSNKTDNKQIEELPNIVEKLNNLYEMQEELNSLNNSYNIAKECIELAYDEVKKNISPKFTENLCKTIGAISSNKYNVIKVSDEDGLIVQIDNGNYVPVDRLSIGTIDQMYLSLRLSSLKEIAIENMPIILDEAFAYFDNERLKNILEYLVKEYSNHQILIFTCSNREEEILKHLNLDYNFLEF